MIYSCRRTQRKLEALKHYKNTSGRFIARVIHIKQTECGRLIPLYDLLLFDHRQRPRRAQRFSELWLDTSKARVSHVYIYIYVRYRNNNTPGSPSPLQKRPTVKAACTLWRTIAHVGEARIITKIQSGKKKPPIHIHTRTPSSMVVFFYEPRSNGPEKKNEIESTKGV